MTAHGQPSLRPPFPRGKGFDLDATLGTESGIGVRALACLPPGKASRQQPCTRFNL
jgi:hypothetical protein